MLTHGEICNIQLLKNLVLNPKDGGKTEYFFLKSDKNLGKMQIVLKEIHREGLTSEYGNDIIYMYLYIWQLSRLHGEGGKANGS